MSISDIILTVLLAAALIGAVLLAVRRRKKGCGCGCPGCSGKCGK